MSSRRDWPSLYLEVDHLKKLGDWLRRHTKRDYLGDHRAEFGSIAQGIEIMKLASSSYYYKVKSDAEGQASSDAELRDHIERIQEEFAGYGYRRLGKQLRREGICVNDKRIRRVQRHYQLFPIRWQSFKIATTDSNHCHKVYPNLLAGLTLTGTNHAWVADITYIRILKGFVYLAALLDRYSRATAFMVGCAGLPVTGTIGGQTIETRVDSKVARYFLANYLRTNTQTQCWTSVSIAFTRNQMAVCPTGRILRN